MPKSLGRTFEKHGKVVRLFGRNFEGLGRSLFEDTSSVVTSVVVSCKLQQRADICSKQM
jgi:hypothetical protein